MADVCSLGECTQTHTIESRYKYEDKVFPIEDAVMLQRDMWARTQILAHQNIDGESATGGDDRILVTFHEDVKPGFQKRLFRDRVKSNGWYSKANGYGCTECGFVGGSTTRVIEVNDYFCTTCVRQEEDICMNQFLGTWKMTSLAKGQLRQEEDIFISDDIYYAFERANYESIDRHFWHGDYKSADKTVMHVDGIIKKLVRAVASDKGDIYEFVFTGLDDTNCIQAVLGGQSIDQKWDTDLTTTLNAFAAQLLEAKKGGSTVSIYKSATVAVDTLTLETQVGEENCLQFLITNYDAATDTCSGIDQCLDGTIKALEDVANGATVAWTQVQSAAGGNAPIAIAHEKITAGNVLSKLDELHNAIQEKKSFLMDFSFGGQLFVSPNVWTALRMALIKETAQYKGSEGPLSSLDDIYGFQRIVKANYLGRDHMIFFRPQDVHVATDLESDITEIQTGYDRKCSIAWFKNKFAIGFHVSEPGNVAGTLCINDTFGEDMPCEVDAV